MLTTTKDQLLEFFIQFGLIGAIRLRTMFDEPLRDQLEVQSHSHINAYIVFENSYSAQKAVECTDKCFYGQMISISPAVHRLAMIKRSVAVGNLDPTATEEDIRMHFNQVARVYHVRIEFDEKGKLVAYVSFKGKGGVERAMTLHGSKLKANPIFLQRGNALLKFYRGERRRQRQREYMINKCKKEEKNQKRIRPGKQERMQEIKRKKKLAIKNKRLESKGLPTIPYVPKMGTVESAKEKTEGIRNKQLENGGILPMGTMPPKPGKKERQQTKAAKAKQWKQAFKGKKQKNKLKLKQEIKTSASQEEGPPPWQPPKKKKKNKLPPRQWNQETFKWINPNLR